jgi:hypothetical protein
MTTRSGLIGLIIGILATLFGFLSGADHLSIIWPLLIASFLFLLGGVLAARRLDPMNSGGASCWVRWLAHWPGRFSLPVGCRIRVDLSRNIEFACRSPHAHPGDVYAALSRACILGALGERWHAFANLPAPIPSTNPIRRWP